MSSKRKKYYIAGVVVVILAMIAIIFYVVPKRDGKVNKGNVLSLLCSKGNYPLIFYGVVVDEGNSPVEGAEVEISWLYWNILHPQGYGYDYKTLKTGKDGRFTLSGVKGYQCGIKGVLKPGYEWVYEMQPHFKYTSPEMYARAVESGYYIPDPDNPVKLVLRKKNPPELVLKDGWYRVRYLEYGEDFTCYDVVFHSRWSLKDEEEGKIKLENTNDKYRPRLLHRDIMYKAEKIEKDGKKICVLTFRAPGEGNGVQQTGGVVYTAPETGYQPEVKIEAPFPSVEEDEPETRINLCFKLRTGMVGGKEKSIYARLNSTYDSLIIHEEGVYPSASFLLINL